VTGHRRTGWTELRGEGCLEDSLEGSMVHDVMRWGGMEECGRERWLGWVGLG